MKIIVFSDSHGKNDGMRRVMLMHRDAYAFLHLGDGAPGFLTLCRELSLAGFAVRGNCDFFTGEHVLEDSMVLTFEGFRFLLTHGDAYGVNWTETSLALAAKEKGCHVALYGHTHVGVNRYLPPRDDSDTPLYLFNPGSISRPRDVGPSFGIIEIKNSQLLLNVAKLR